MKTFNRNVLFVLTIISLATIFQHQESLFAQTDNKPTSFQKILFVKNNTTHSLTKEQFDTFGGSLVLNNFHLEVTSGTLKEIADDSTEVYFEIRVCNNPGKCETDAFYMFAVNFKKIVLDNYLYTNFEQHTYSDAIKSGDTFSLKIYIYNYETKKESVIHSSDIKIIY